MTSSSGVWREVEELDYVAISQALTKDVWWKGVRRYITNCKRTVD